MPRVTISRLIGDRSILRLRTGIAVFAGAVLMLALLTPSNTSAASATWSTVPGSEFWSASGNWVPVTVPNGPSDAATFDASSITNVSVTANIQVANIIFTTGATTPFTITVRPNLILTISGAGVANNSGRTQNFVSDAASPGSGEFGAIHFTNGATAGIATTFTMSRGAVGGGIVQFYDNSTASHGSFTIDAGAVAFFDNSSAGSGIFATGAIGSLYFRGSSSGSDGSFTTSDGGRVLFLEAARAGNGIFITNLFSEIQFLANSSADHGSFTNNGDVSGGFFSGGAVRFYSNSTAGNASFLNKGTIGNNGPSGVVVFADSSSAGSGVFTNNGGTVSNGGGGRIEIRHSSTASNATFINNGGEVSAAIGGFISLNNEATGANGLFINNGGAASGAEGSELVFFNSSSAGSATLIANGGVPGAEGGSILFLFDSTGGTSRVEVYGNGSVDISGNNSSVTLGSLEGDGKVFLGGRRLMVGSNNAVTTFEGVIQDGGWIGSSGGSLTKIGGGTLVLSGANAYTGGTIVQSGRLQINNFSGSGTGSEAVTVNSGGVLGGTGTIAGPVTVNAGATLSGGEARTASGSLRMANNLTLNSGSIIELGLGPSGACSTLARTGGTWIFGSDQAFAFVNSGAEPGLYDNVISGLAGDPGGTASWTITTPGFVGTFTYDGAGNIDLTITAAPPPPGSLGNISTRLRVETGDNVLIGGFIITGTQPKRIIVRAIGPSLPLPGALADPILELRNSSGGLLATNNNWRTGGQEAEIIATTIPPSSDLESAIVATLPANGAAYTAIVRGVGNGTGIGVVEAYDLDQSVNSKLGNISTRGFVQTGDDVLIGGLIVLGQHPLRVIARAIGPSLPFQEALGDPTLNLHDGNGALIASNDNWRDDPVQEAEIIATGIPPSDDLESAIVRNLAPGSYTAIVRGASNTTGIAVIEAYGLN